MLIQRKLILILSVLLILGFTSTSVVSYLVSQHSLRHQIMTNELPLTCDNIYSEIQRDLLVPVFISSLMSNDTFLRNWVINGEKDVGDISQYLTEINNKYHTFTSFFVSEKTRNYYYANGILKTVRPGEERDLWYFRVRGMTPDYEINVDPDMAHKDTMTIFINHRVFDFKRDYIGAVGVGLKVSMVKAMIESYHKKYHRTIYFVAPDGKVVLQSSEVVAVAERLQNFPGLGKYAQQILKDEETSVEYRKDGGNFYLNSRFIPELNWFLLVEQSDSSVVANIFRTMVANLIFCGLITALVIAITWRAIGSYQKKLEKIIKSDLELQGVNHDQKLQIEQQHVELVAQNLKLKKLNASKDKLFSIIAHDLRDPIGGIMQLLYLLEDAFAAGDRTRTVEIFEKLKSVSETSFKLLENLSEWAINQISEISCQPKAFMLHPLLLESLQVSQILAERKNIVVTVDCNDTVQVFADPNMVRAIIRNLMSNAIKFTRKNGNVQITVKIEEEQVWISVRDNGVGIARENLPGLFDFVGGGSSFGTEGEKGTGLGLSLCKDLVALNNGEIRVESQPDNGSTFSFSLKKATAADSV